MNTVCAFNVTQLQLSTGPNAFISAAGQCLL
jgi:hypothetical protein